MDMEKEKWKDEVMNSLDGMKRAIPPDDLFNKIEQRLAEAPQQEKRIVPQWWAAAAGLLLIIGLNAYVLTLQAKSDGATSKTEYAVGEDYNELISTYYLYESYQ